MVQLTTMTFMMIVKERALVDTYQLKTSWCQCALLLYDRKILHLKEKGTNDETAKR